MIERPKFQEMINKQFEVHSVCALLGPRQCGKTTLSKQFSATYPEPIHRFDLENPEDLLSLSNPMRLLEDLKGLIIIDEIQRLPNLFPPLRVLIDKKQAKYLILGSASRDLIQQSSETLTGRIGYIELTPFQLEEVFENKRLMLRGGFPSSYLAGSDKASFLWRKSYTQTFLERDIPNLGFSVPPLTLLRFWMMLTHVHGNLLNMNELATSLGVSGHTIRQYIDILAGTFMIRVLHPWFESINKRQVKTPKIYFRDSGILLSLLSIHTEEDLLRHPRLGAIWEGYAIEQIINSLNIRSEEAFFWRTGHGAELDLFVPFEGKRIGFEFKYADTPATTKSMHSAIVDLKLDHLFVIYPGKRKVPLTDKITGIGLEDWIVNKPSIFP
jgi:hypothetical protein